MFKTIANPDGTISIVPIEQTNNLPFNVGGQLFNQFNNAGAVPNQTSFDPRSLQSIFPTNVQTGIMSSSAAIPFENDPVAIAQGFTRNTPSDQGTNFQFLPSANEADEIDEVKRPKRGIAKLFEFLSNFIPGFGILKRLGDSRGIQSLNQRLRNTDFGRSKNLMDYLDIKSYGGYDEREDARRATIKDAARITSGLKRTAADDVIDRGRGQIPTRTTSAPKRSFSKSYSDAKKAFRS